MDKRKRPNHQADLITKAAPPAVLKANEIALESYKHYRETADLIERLDVVLGKKSSFKSDVGSTLNFEINRHALASTTAQTI